MISFSVKAESLVLTASTEQATAGYFQLNWSWPDAPEDAIYQLSEQSLEGEASGAIRVNLYEGMDMASAISGKSDGRYEYQVIAKSGKLPGPVLSNRVTVNVAHHSLTNAFIVLSIGVVIFIAIITVIFRGAHQTG